MIFQRLLISNITPQFSTMIRLKNFFCPPLLREEIISTYGSKIFALNKDKPTYEATKKYFERKKEEELDAVESLKKKKKKKS